jgi:hypothetical protein
MLNKLYRPVSRSSATYVCFACRANQSPFPLPLRNLATEATSASPDSELELPRLAYPPPALDTPPSAQLSRPDGGEASLGVKPKKMRTSKNTVTSEVAKPLVPPLQAKDTTKRGPALPSRGRRRKTRRPTESPLLQLYNTCLELKLNKALYEITELHTSNKRPQYQSRVTVNGQIFSDGTLYPRKQAAKEAVASKALEYVKSLSMAEHEQPVRRQRTTKEAVQTVENDLTNTEPVSAEESVLRKVQSAPRAREHDMEPAERHARVAAAIDRYLEAGSQGTARKGLVTTGLKQPELEARRRPILRGHSPANRKAGRLTVRDTKASPGPALRVRQLAQPLVRRCLMRKGSTESPGVAAVCVGTSRTGLREQSDHAQMTLKEALLGRRRPQLRRSNPAHASTLADREEEHEIEPPKVVRNNYKPLGFQQETTIESVAVNEIIARSKSNTVL